jgi:hypothetical protein
VKGEPVPVHVRIVPTTVGAAASELVRTSVAERAVGAEPAVRTNHHAPPSRIGPLRRLPTGELTCVVAVELSMPRSRIRDDEPVAPSTTEA